MFANIIANLLNILFDEEGVSWVQIRLPCLRVCLIRDSLNRGMCPEKSIREL
jgi:hypothetical protein